VLLLVLHGMAQLIGLASAPVHLQITFLLLTLSASCAS
jgi:hypothetical protein